MELNRKQLEKEFSKKFPLGYFNTDIEDKPYIGYIDQDYRYIGNKTSVTFINQDSRKEILEWVMEKLKTNKESIRNGIK